MKKLRLDGFEMSSRLTFSLICVLAAVMHITFLILFLKFKVDLLAKVNIGSVAFYITCWFLSLFKLTGKHPTVWISVIFAEITLHAVLCTLIVGVDTCFVLYPIISMPICVCYLFLYTDRKYFKRSVIIFVTLTVLFTGAAVAVTEFYGGSLPLNIFVLTRKEKMILRSTNILYAGVTLFGFTLMFYIEMTNMMLKLRESTDKLKYTATHDALTGLTNRRSFWEFFEELRRDGKHYNIAMGDLDSFKRINDTYGHGCGDQVLRSVADVINESTNENEIACRWGGEEMVVVLIGERESALERLEKIRTDIEALSLDYEGLKINVTMTFGFADSDELHQAIEEGTTELEIPESAEALSKHSGVESLISIVDKRLYVGKGSGKNVVVDK